jgi:hypothetical protein
MRALLRQAILGLPSTGGKEQAGGSRVMGLDCLAR